MTEESDQERFEREQDEARAERERSGVVTPGKVQSTDPDPDKASEPLEDQEADEPSEAGTDANE